MVGLSHSRGRLLVAALVCAIALGLGWEASRSSTGYLNPGLVLPTTWVSPVSGDLIVGSQYYPGAWVAGDPMRTRRGFQSDARVVVVPASVALLAVSRQRTELRVRLARAALVALAVVGFQALTRGMVAPALAMALAVGLAAPALVEGWSAVCGLFGPEARLR